MASGIYREGGRFLSKRKICQMWKVSEPTAKSAIRNLIDAGLIVARPRSGLILQPNFQQQAFLLLHKLPGTKLPPAPNWESKRQLLIRQGKTKVFQFGVILDEEVPAGTVAVDVGALQASRRFFQEATRRGCKVEYFYQNGTREREEFILGELRRKEIDAATFFRRVRTQFLEPLIRRTLRLGIPVATLFDDCESVATSSVNFNNIGAGFHATKVLLEQGHRHIAVLLHERFLANVELRFEGCRLAVEESKIKEKITLTPCRLVEGEDPSRVLAKTFLQRKNRPTALFACGATLYLQIEPILRSLGLRVPRNLSVIACGNPNLLPANKRRLDLMKCDFAEAGRAVFDLLASLLEGKPVERSVLLPTPYIAAGSVAPRRRARS